MTASKITVRPIHLGLGATAEIEPEFTGGMEWYGAYSARHADVDAAATALFITAGDGTEHRSR